MNKKARLLYLVFSISISAAIFGSNNRLLVIDTGFNDLYVYKNFIELAKSVGFNVKVKSFYTIRPETLNSYSCILIHLDDSFVGDYLKHQEKLQDASSVTKKIISLLDQLRKGKNRLIGFMLPSKMGSTIKSSCKNTLDLLMPYVVHTSEVKKSLLNFLKELMQPDTKRSAHYHTTLLTKMENNENGSEISSKLTMPNFLDERTNTMIVGHLPFHKFHNLPPLAWYCSDQKQTGKHYVITKASLLLFSDIGENFLYSPLDFSLRLERLKELQQFLYEIYRVCVVGKFSKSCSSHALTFPYLFSKNYLLDAKKRFKAQRSLCIDSSLYKWVERELVWCGWGGLDAYDKDSAVNSLLDLGLNLVWFQMNPECYLANLGIKKKEKNLFFQKISSLTEKLGRLSGSRPIPHFFVGTEITCNYLNEPVKNPAVDCYGTVYTKIPAPLDFENFWKKEFLDVFDKLVAEWPAHAHEIPLAGIFLDLEMYHAQDQTGHYLDCMDFSDSAWHEFCKVHYNKSCFKFKNVKVRVEYLLKNGLMDTYFDVLQKRACEIGGLIREHIYKKLPGALIGVYDIHLPHSWFYKGFLSGLSSKKRPIILATFNNDFYCHYAWLVKNGIFAYHLPALLLSKFKTKRDFNLVSEVAQFHDGAWFNRISRLEEPRNQKNGSWDYNVEVTPLATDVFAKNLQTTIKEIQSNLSKSHY